MAVLGTQVNKTGKIPSCLELRRRLPSPSLFLTKTCRSHLFYVVVGANAAQLSKCSVFWVAFLV